MLMKTLLSEFRNYSTFPNLQVERIAKVWGKILCEDILDGTDQFLSHFLKRVIDALQQGMQGEERLSLFGETALQRFILGKPELEARKMLKSKPIYHDFCKRIVDVIFKRPGGEKKIQPPKMVQMIKEGASHKQNPAPASRQDMVEPPPENIRDKIKFSINNLS